MNTGPNPERLAKNAFILALIITVIKLSLFIFNYIQVPHNFYTAVYMFFPHIVFEYLQRLIFIVSGFPSLADFPLLSVLLAIAFCLSVKQLRKTSGTLGLKICYLLLMISICIDIPVAIQDYFIAMKLYKQYEGFAARNGSGILGLIDDFAGMMKPSLAMLILEEIILVAYLCWSGLQVKLLFAFDKQKSIQA